MTNMCIHHNVVQCTAYSGAQCVLFNFSLCIHIYIYTYEHLYVVYALFYDGRTEFLRFAIIDCAAALYSFILYIYTATLIFKYYMADLSKISTFFMRRMCT